MKLRCGLLLNFIPFQLVPNDASLFCYELINDVAIMINRQDILFRHFINLLQPEANSAFHSNEQEDAILKKCFCQKSVDFSNID